MRKLLTAFSTLYILIYSAHAQQTFPVNGLADERNTWYAITNANIYTDYKTLLEGATLLIRKNKVVAAGRNILVPKEAVIIDVAGKYIYPSFIDLCSDYGMPTLKQDNTKRGPQFLANTPGAYCWNQAVKPETEACRLFSPDSKKAEEYRKSGFGIVLTQQQDGIARGSAVVVALSDENENELIILDRAAAGYSFDKGISKQDYPSSLMGSIALLRQTFYDAEWYQSSKNEEYNISLQAIHDQKKLPKLFTVSDYQNALRASKIGDEFGIDFIIKGNGDEYKRIDEIKKTGAAYIIPLKYPDVYDVSDAYDALNVSVADLKNWELSPANSSMLEKAGITFAFTTDGLKDKKDVFKNVIKAIEFGLSKEQALKALTFIPAQLLKIDDKVGTLKPGMLANFIICGKEFFKEENVIFENWVSGKRYIVRKADMPDLRGKYKLRVDSLNLILRITGDSYNPDWKVEADTLSNKVEVSVTDNIYSLQFNHPTSKSNYRLTGVLERSDFISFKGTGQNSGGDWASWQVVFDSVYIEKPKVDTSKKEKPSIGDVWFPNMAFGFKAIPASHPVLIRNTTIWTNEKEGILQNTDVLIENGKIVQLGKNLSSKAASLETIDGTGKHLTAGIIDEHSHIAASGDLNESTQASSAEVRVGDIIDANDINIYRQLAGGVTSSHILHGSANPIGGQTQLIKLRWGNSAEELKFKNWDPFIKFALGENVKQSHWGDDQTIRYPQTRMGVEQVYIDAFTRARAYDKKWGAYALTKDKTKAVRPRKDLELEALAEILNKKRFITCHSYVQSEINMLMHVADSFDFRVNTFTHILEGYKVADKMKKHGVGASSFADWWAYKYEVMEAIPYNPAMLHKMGVTTAVNSDDAEMARRLNQEAAKAIKYGEISEEEALKFVTLNPAKLLHVDDRVGSIKAGKDADIVLWNNNPLSVYAKPVKTFVDGICYYDETTDKQLHDQLQAERLRIIQKMIAAKNKGAATQKPASTSKELQHCNNREEHP